MNTRTDYLPLSLLLAILFGLVPSALAYHFLLPPLTAANGSFELLWSSVWQGTLFNHQDVLARIGRTWPWLIENHYGAYLTASLLAASVTAGAWVALTRRQPQSLLYAVLGWLAGVVVALVIGQAMELPTVWKLLAMPVAAFVGSYLVLLFTAPPLPELAAAIVRGTKIVPFKADTKKAVAQAIQAERVCLAGHVMDRKAEVRSALLLGASGTGKSAAVVALMRSITARGDRVVVADPDGAALSLFWKAGDIILNPLDRRSVRWDLLAEIERPSDFQHLAESILPYTGDGKIDEWRRHSQEIFSGCLETWHKEKLGTSDEFLTTMALGGEAKLRLLCQGTAAAGYFGEGGQKMLASILNTLLPALAELGRLVGPQGELFSVRRWLRDGTGRLWIPYGADEIAALRGPISCWMRLAIFELLAMPESDTRRVWFFLDELDALGRIQGLKDAMVRGRKKGGCIVAGIQSIAQVRAVYGDAEAQTITEQFGTQLILKCGASEGGGTARFASDLIGQREVEHLETSTSHNRGQDGPSTTTSFRRQLELAVLPSEITQLPDLTGYLRVSGRPDWLKLSFQWIDVEAHASPREPVKLASAEPAGPVPGGGPIEAQAAHDVAGAASAADEKGPQRPSFPFSPERVFNLTAELYGREHPQRPPAPRLEGEYQELARMQAAYEAGWINVIWPDFRRWWLNAPEEERYHRAVVALRPAGLELSGFDAIPEGVWDQVKALRPAEGTTPFLNRVCR